jgi:hypothetical protein
LAEYRASLAEQQKQLSWDARASMRAVTGWGTVQTEEEWLAAVDKAREDYARGAFLIERLGAERFLDPPLLAVLLTLRRRLMEEEGATTAAEAMMVDCAVLSYYHLLRVNGWIGNLALVVEREFFGLESPTVKLRSYYGSREAGKLNVEETAQRIGEQFMPLLDRANRMMLRNLRAIRERKVKPAPSVTIGAAAQVNLAQQQVNVAAGEAKD